MAEVIKYPRHWKNKTSGQIVRVMPWWEVVKNGEIETVDELGQMISNIPEMDGRICKVGVLVQIGYLLENRHGVWFGFGSKVSKQFDDLGEWKEEKKICKKKSI